MRVIAGTYRSRQLASPPGLSTRPTSDRLRETLFNILEHGHGGVAGLRVIDLFAGTGALAIEAISRGAAFALLVDDGADARAAIRDNVDALGLGGVTRVFRRDARKLGAAPAGDRFDLAFLDPPYGRSLAEPALVALHNGCWLAPGALCIVEEAISAHLAPPEGYTTLDEREFGDTRLVVLRTSGEGA